MENKRKREKEKYTRLSGIENKNSVDTQRTENINRTVQRKTKQNSDRKEERRYQEGEAFAKAISPTTN